MEPRKELRQLLHNQNLKKTSQRELIWNVLLEAKGHPSVEQIRDLLLEKGHRIGIATIYRTLKILLASGLVRQSRQHGMTRYEPVVGEPNHLHFICNNCGSNVEFASRKVEGLIKRVTREFGFEERYSRYVISGLCKACLQKEADTSAVSERHRVERVFLRDALEITLAIERRGYTFYTNAARRAKDDGGRRMFQRLAAEESDHLRRLQAEYKSLIDGSPWLKQEPSRLSITRKIAEDIFPQKVLLRIDVHEQTSDLEALNIAMDLERRSHQFFKDFARQITDASGKKVFMDFAEDEGGHLQTLEAEYNSIVRREKSGSDG
jgi:Fur family ferric uptake transcriptional regulator